MGETKGGGGGESVILKNSREKNGRCFLRTIFPNSISHPRPIVDRVARKVVKCVRTKFVIDIRPSMRGVEK